MCFCGLFLDEVSSWFRTGENGGSCSVSGRTRLCGIMMIIFIPVHDTSPIYLDYHPTILPTGEGLLNNPSPVGRMEMMFIPQ